MTPSAGWVRGTLRGIVVAALAAAPAAAGEPVDPSTVRVGGYERLAPEVVLIRDATVWTQGPDGVLEGADVLVRGGKIAAVGRDLTAPPGATIVEAAGKHVTPGLIDCHSHTAIRGGVNEGSNNVTAEVRIADVVDPDDVDLYRQLAGGLTAAHLLHGSANSIGGQDAVIKLKWGESAEDLIVRDAPAGIKFALGENPKRSNFRSDRVPQRYPATRMGVMASIRERFLAARDYDRAWERWNAMPARARARAVPPRRDLQLEAIAEILRGERLVHSHSYRQDEILALIRVAEEFGFRIATFQHVLEGYKVADELAAHGAGASTFSDWWAFKLEAFDAIPYNGALMTERGVTVTFNSDSSELARRLNLEAAKAVRWGGLDPQAALDLVTRNAAVQLGIDRRTGSLEAGKDADLVVWSGDPLSSYSIVEQTWVEGVRRFDRGSDLAHREVTAAARDELARRIREGDAATPPAAPEAAPTETATAADAEPPPSPSAGWTSPGFPVLAIDPPDGTEAVSFVHATVHTMVGDAIADGTVVIRNGAVVAVGAGLPPAEGSRIVDATGLHLLPGLIDAHSALGLTEIGSVAGGVDIAEIGEINPEADTAIAINPDSELIPVTRAGGITHALVVPGGGLVRGTSTLARLDGWTWEDLAVARPVALHLDWPSFRIQRLSFGGDPPSEADQVRRRDEALRRIDTLFDDALAYRRARTSPASGRPVPDTDPAFEAMIPVLDGRVPLIVHADEVRQIRSALAWAERRGLALAIAGSGDLGRVAEELAARDVPAILTGVLALPTRDDEPYDTRYTEAARLHAAGVRLCIAGAGGGFGTSNARNLAHHAAMAAAFGLPREEALRAVTRYPAEILGAADRLGTIAPGMSASLVLTDGDPLEIRSRVVGMWIDGREIDVRANRHDRLYDRYRSRPRPSAATGGERATAP